MTYHIEFEDQDELIQLYGLLVLLKKLEVVKFNRLSITEHWTSTGMTLTIDFKN